MTDGTGTQTDEVRGALAGVSITATAIAGLGAQWSYTAAALRRDASVLSAEIERLTRRVEELQGRAPALTGLQEAMIEMGFYQPELLASAAAPDERVLAERERCAKIADPLPFSPQVTDIEKQAHDIRAVIAETIRNVSIPSNYATTTDYRAGYEDALEAAENAIRARTRDQDTAP